MSDSRGRSSVRRCPNCDRAPTISAAAITEHGVIRGTVPYMYPEQAKGLTVDRRSDVWSFGCVLFEMLTGRRAFQGATPAKTLGAILHKTPDWSLLPADTPSSIRALLRRCLARDRAHRLDSATAARIEIDEALNGQNRRRRQAAAARVHGRGGAWRCRCRRGVAIATLGPMERWVEPATELRVDIATPLSTNPYSFAVSPDGRKMAYAGAGAQGPHSLWVRGFDRDAPVMVPNTEGAVIRCGLPIRHRLHFSPTASCDASISTAERRRRWPTLLQAAAARGVIRVKSSSRRTPPGRSA